MKTKNINVGETCFDSKPTMITTVVGSCIAFCVWDKRLQIGGMAHYALPCTEIMPNGNKKDSNYCGPIAIKSLFRELKERGSLPSDIVVKICGGAHVLENVSNAVGERNIQIAKDLCRNFGIKITSAAVGGPTGYKVKFYTATGDLYVQKLAQSASRSVANKEKQVVTASGVSCSVSPTTKPVSHLRAVKETRNPIPTKTAPAMAGKPVANLSPKGPVRVLIVDDSKVIQSLFKVMLTKDPGFEVFGIATDPLEAEKLMQTDQPDVITLDMQMPNMDGLTYLRKYLPRRKLPIIMVSGANNDDGNLALKALDLGAVDFVEKPSADRIKEFGPIIKDKIKAASRVQQRHLGASKKNAIRLKVKDEIDPKKIVVIGASTGGTVALSQVLSSLPDNIPPILIVQHIPETFSDLFAQRVNSLVDFEVKEAKNNDIVRPNRVLIAPGNKQMKIKARGSSYYVLITDDPPVNKHKPSVDYFFESVIKYVGANAVAGILTGMGRDGAQGLLGIKNSGGQTFAQDENSSVVYGMPKAAFELGAADNVYPLDEIAFTIMNCVSKKKSRKSA